MSKLYGWTAAAMLAASIAVAALRLPFSRFAEEEITIDVWPQEVVVTGSYQYENVLPISIRQSLIAPLPAEPYSIDSTPCRLVRVDRHLPV